MKIIDDEHARSVSTEVLFLLVCFIEDTSRDDKGISYSAVWHMMAQHRNNPIKTIQQCRSLHATTECNAPYNQCNHNAIKPYNAIHRYTTHHTTLHYTTLPYPTSHTLCHITPHHTTLHRTTPCHNTLHFTTPHHTTPHLITIHHTSSH